MLNNDIARMKQTVLNISTNALAELTGIGSNRLSAFLCGTKQLHNAEIILLDTLFDDLTCLTEIAAPFPVLFKNVPLIRDLIKRMRGGEFSSRSEQQQ